MSRNPVARTSASFVRSTVMLLTLSSLVSRYGIFGVALGAGLEGEAAVVTGGILASHSLFNPFAAAFAAWAGSLIADQIFFVLGRSQRNGRFVTNVSKKAVFTRALTFIDRYPVAFCFTFRFVYGFRVAGPVAIGVSHVPARQFFGLNCASAALWAAIFTTLGYRFGPRLERAVHAFFTPTILFVMGSAALLLIGGIYFQRRRSLRRSAATLER